MLVEKLEQVDLIQYFQQLPQLAADMEDMAATHNRERPAVLVEAAAISPALAQAALETLQA